MTEEEFKETIYQFLVNDEKGSTASDIASAIGSNRMTVTKYLNVMKGQDLVTYRGVGMAKLWTVQHSPLLNSFENGNNRILKEAMNLLTEGVCVLDRDLKFVWYNKALESILGKLEENKGVPCNEVYERKGIMKKDMCVIKTFRTGQVHRSFQEMIVEGKKFYFESIASPIRDKDGKVIAVMVLLINYNDYKEKMKGLKELVEG